MCVCVPTWSTCQRACFSLNGTVTINVPACHTACQCVNLACQRTKRRANFSDWRVNLSKAMPVFQTFLLRIAKENFYTLLLCKKFYIT